MTPKEWLGQFYTLTLLPSLRRMFGKRRRGNTALLIAAFYLIGSMLGVICLSHHINVAENDRLSADYTAYITSSAAGNTAEDAAAAAEVSRHILASRIELTAIFVFLMSIWGLLSSFALWRIFTATVEQDKYIFGLYVTFGSDTHRLRRHIHTEFLLAALFSLLAALPTASLAVRSIYLRNGQRFDPGPAPYLLILACLFAISLLGANLLSRRIAKSSCIELLSAQDCSDYTTSPRTSRRLGRRLQNGSMRYARLAILRMRRYYIPLVLAVSLVAAVFFASMNLALGGERNAAQSVHEYSIEFARGLTTAELSTGYLDHLYAIEDVAQVDALANAPAEQLGSHLLADKTLFLDGDDTRAVDAGSYYATDDIHIICADGDTRDELGRDVVLPPEWQDRADLIETSFNYGSIPGTGEVIYLYPEERAAHLDVKVGDTLSLALPRGQNGALLSDKAEDGLYEYRTVTVTRIVEIPGVHFSPNPSESTYVCPRITDDYLLLNPADYAAVTATETVEALTLDELYREDLPFGNLKSPAVLLVPEDTTLPAVTTIQMLAPTTQVTEPYSVTDPFNVHNQFYLNSDRFFRNLTAANTYFFFGGMAALDNNATASNQLSTIVQSSLYKYAYTELTVAERIVCPGLSEPCLIIPNDNNYFSSWSGDLCLLQLELQDEIYRVADEVFAFGTDQPLTRREYLGREIFIHTELEPGFLQEMHDAGLYTTYDTANAAELSNFHINGLFEIGNFTYFLCALSRDSNLGIDRYPAYVTPGDDFIFLETYTGKTALRLSQTASYLKYPAALQRSDSGLFSLPLGAYAATVGLTLSVADTINAEALTPELDIPPLVRGQAVLVLHPNSPLAVAPGDYLQLAIQGDTFADPNDPQLAALVGNDRLAYLLELGAQYDYLSLQLLDVQMSDATTDVLYLCEEDWQRLRRAESTYDSFDIYLFGDTDLVGLIRSSAEIRALIGNWQSVENRVTLVEHDRLFEALTTGACNYPALIRTLSILLILLLPLLWLAPQRMHFGKRHDEFAVMEAVGRTRHQLRRMIGTECLLITLTAGVFVALLCPFSLLCVQVAIYLLELPFETTALDIRAYLFMVGFVMLSCAASFLAAARHIGAMPRQTSKKGTDRS